MARPGQVGNNAQPFKLTIESFNRLNNAGGAANAPRQFANAQPAAAPQPAVAQAQPRRGFLAWLTGLFKSATPATPPEPTAKEFNNRVLGGMKAADASALPQDFRDALAYVTDNLRARFGVEKVPNGAKFSEIVGSAALADALDARRTEADGQGRRLTAADIAEIYAECAMTRFSFEAIGAKIADKARSMGVESMFTKRAAGAQFSARCPQIAAEIRCCKSPAELEAVLQRYDANMAEFVRMAEATGREAKAALPAAADKLAAAFGADGRFVAGMFNTEKLSARILELSSRIVAGREPGSTEPGFDVKAAYARVVDGFVQERLDYCSEIDALDIEQGLKETLKSELFGLRELPKLRPAQILQLAQSVDMGKIEGIAGKGMPAALVGGMLASQADKLKAAVAGMAGPEAIATFGADDFTPVYNWSLAMALAGKPAVKQGLAGRIDDCLNEACANFQKAGMFDAAHLTAAVVAVAKPLAQNPAMSEPKYLRLVGKEADAALSEAGVTDAQVRADAKAAILHRAKAVLGRETGIGALSNAFLVLRAEAAELGRALDFVAKTRSSAKSVAATTIAVSTGLGKGHVLNNLDASGLVSDCGKLRFLYDDIVGKAKGGAATNAAEAANKANDIVAKFAFAKIEVLKSINDAGFDVADKAEFTTSALRSGDWKSPNVAIAAKRIAESALMKTAVASLATILKDGSSMGDDDLRDAFVMFGMKFAAAMREDLNAHGDEWAGGSDTLQLVQSMVVRFAAKNHPDIAESLASLGATGRLKLLADALTDNMKALHARKMDFMLLVQYNMLGEPAGEKIREAMKDPALRYDKAAHDECVMLDEASNVANGFFAMFTNGVPSGDAVAAAKYVALNRVGPGMVAKYSGSLANETVPLLKNLVGKLDWRAGKAEASEEIVKKFVEDMKDWRDVAPGSQDAAGLEAVLARRTEGYLIDTLAGLTQNKFDRPDYPGLAGTFVQDITRCTYRFNGVTAGGKDATTASIVAEFEKAIPDPAKRKVLSAIASQQLFGDLSASVNNRLPFSSWKAGMGEEPIANIPGIEKFAARDIFATGNPLFGSGPMTFDIRMSEDGKSAKIVATAKFPLAADVSLPKVSIGNCVCVQSFTVDFGNPPAIKDFSLSQTFAA